MPLCVAHYVRAFVHVVAPRFLNVAGQVYKQSSIDPSTVIFRRPVIQVVTFPLGCDGAKFVFQSCLWQRYRLSVKFDFIFDKIYKCDWIVANHAIHLHFSELQQNLTGGLIGQTTVDEELQNGARNAPAYNVIIQIFRRGGARSLLRGFLTVMMLRRG